MVFQCVGLVKCELPQLPLEVAESGRVSWLPLPSIVSISSVYLLLLAIFTFNSTHPKCLCFWLVRVTFSVHVLQWTSLKKKKEKHRVNKPNVNNAQCVFIKHMKVNETRSNTRCDGMLSKSHMSNKGRALFKLEAPSVGTTKTFHWYSMEEM